ncbi:MAG: exopolysaccharide biosynthesis protein [Alphaproteobacteria bacterium]
MSEDGQLDSLTDVLDRLQEGTDGNTVSLADIVSLFGQRTFGPLLLVPGLLAVSPVGVIPGMPTALGITVVFIAGQILFGRQHIWLPSRLESISFSRDRMTRGVEKFRPWARRIDAILSHRLTTLTDRPVLSIIAVVCLLVALSMAPLELIPFAVFAPGLAIVGLGLGLTARDGYVIICGFVLAATTLGLGAYALTTAF